MLSIFKFRDLAVILSFICQCQGQPSIPGSVSSLPVNIYTGSNSVPKPDSDSEHSVSLINSDSRAEWQAQCI